MKVERCPECGSRHLAEGKFSGYANLSASAWKSSPVIAVVCSDCGLVVELRVKNPGIFAPKIR